MSSSDPIAALDIGTSRTVLAIGEALSGGRVKIVTVKSIPSRGVRKGQIIDLGQVRVSIESLLKQVSDLNYSIGQAFLTLSGPHVQVQEAVGQSAVENGTVSEEDMREVYDKCTDVVLPQDRSLIDLVPMTYSLDDVQNIDSPKGMSGRLLTLHALAFHTATSRLTDAVACANEAKLEIINDPYFSGTCVAEALLTTQKKKEGVVVIDLGGGSTAYTVWVSGHLVHAGVLGVGGDHVTNDISLAFSLSMAQAEGLKTKYAQALLHAEDMSQRVSVPNPSPGFSTASISLRALNTVVNARMHELFSIVREKLEAEHVLHHIHGGFILTGGGAELKDVVELAASVFGAHVAKGTYVNDFEGLEVIQQRMRCAPVLGLLLSEARKQVPKPSFRDSFLKLFGHSQA